MTTCVGRTVEAVLAKGGAAFITADHGNADKMYEADGIHRLLLIQLILFRLLLWVTTVNSVKAEYLADIAPTMLKVMGLEQPAEMTGTSIIK